MSYPTQLRQFDATHSYTASMLGTTADGNVQFELDTNLPCPTPAEIAVTLQLFQNYNKQLADAFSVRPMGSICSVLRARNYGAVHDAVGEMVYCGVPPYTLQQYPVVMHVFHAGWICEQTECYARQFNTTWMSNFSHGEALSRFMGESILPVIMQPFGIQSVPSWLNAAGRPDWVSRIQLSETDPIAVGCALAFLHYLRDELRFPIQKIIAASGDTLAQKFQALTGKPAADAYPAFRAAIDRKYPVGKPVANVLSIDSPFLGYA